MWRPHEDFGGHLKPYVRRQWGLVLYRPRELETHLRLEPLFTSPIYRTSSLERQFFGVLYTVPEPATWNTETGKRGPWFLFDPLFFKFFLGCAVLVLFLHCYESLICSSTCLAYTLLSCIIYCCFSEKSTYLHLGKFLVCFRVRLFINWLNFFPLFRKRV